MTVPEGFEAIKRVAGHALASNKPFLMNLAAPFICRDVRLREVLPYVDVLFGNSDEAREFSNANHFGTDMLEEIALRLSGWPKAFSLNFQC